MSDEKPPKHKITKLSKREKEVFDRHHKQKKELLVLKNRMRHHKPETVAFSYADLRDTLAKMTPDQLAQAVQIMGPCGHIGAPVMLEPVIGCGTIEDLCHVDGKVETDTRSSVDFKHHPESFILLSDYNGHGEDGDTAYLMEKDEDGELIFIGNVTGKKRPIIERGENEPSVFASRTNGFAVQKIPYSQRNELPERMEVLCRKSDTAEGLTPEEAAELNNIQAELYRRTFHLSKRDKPQ